MSQFRQNLLLHILTGAIVLPLMVCTYWLVWPYKPVVELSDPRPVYQVIHPGDTFPVIRHFCINVDETTESVRSLVTAEGVKITLSSVKHATPVGCHTRTHVIVTPDWIPPGVYQYDAALTLEVNPLRNMMVHLKPVSVRITARD